MPPELDQLDPMGQSAGPEMDSPALPNGETDREGAMAKADLYKLANYSHKLFQQINDEDQLEGWVQAKITKAADYIASVYHYLEYEMKFSEYGKALDNSDVLSEGQKRVLKNRLMEAKSKMKELKKAQAEKAKEKKVDEGILSGGERACTECGGTGMVYEEPKAVPGHVKSKVDAYKRLTKATHAAHKRMDANNNGIPDDEEVDENLVPVPNPSGAGSAEEAKKLGSMMPAPAGGKDPIATKEGFDDKSKEGDSFKTKTGVATKTSTGVKHTNTSYKDEGDEIASNAKSGKGVKSHAKAQSAAEKKEKAPALKKSKTGTWGMENSEKFDNRKKEAKVDEAKKKGDGNLANNAKPYDKVTRGDVIAGRLGKDEKGGKAVKEAAKPSAGLSKAKKSEVVKDAKAGKDIGKPGKSFDKVAKAAGGGKKGEKIAAAAMWKNMKETTAYMAEKKAVVKDLPGNQEKIDVAEPKGKIDGKDMAALRAKKETVKESSDLTRMRELTGRLNLNENVIVKKSNEVDQLKALTNLFKG
jgi:hypothetical protein